MDIDDDTDFHVAGVILKLELTNFMCHASLALDFNPAVNFIVGKNGSGKSAIMTALMVVLGSKAADTSRGKSLSNFIKNGSNQARIKVTLRNTGGNAFKPEKYGSTIALVRTITRAAGKFTVNTLEGGSIHLPRVELDNILQAFSIKLPNPFALLTQETMKTFLNSSKPNQMYDLVREGTGVKDAQKKIAELCNNLKWMESKEKKLIKDLEVAKTELKKWTDKRKVLDKVTNAKERVVALKNEALWAKVVAEEAKLNTFENQLQKYITSRRDKEKGLEAFQKKVEKIKLQISEHEVNLASWTFQMDQKTHERDAFMKAWDTSKQETNNLQREFTSIGNKLKTKSEDKKVLENGIKKYAKQSSPEEIARREEKRQLVEQMKVELDDIKATKGTLNMDLDRQKSECRSNTNLISESRNNIRNLKASTQRQRSDLEMAKKQSGQLPPVYGPKMANFLKEIDKAHAQKQFTKKPIGPIGMNIKVRDDTWSLAVEGYLRSECANFFCNTNEDRIVLTNICKRVMPGHLTVVASKFVDKLFDVSRNKAVASGNLVNLMDMLEVKNPVVMNYLIDQKRIESILLCPTTQEAMQLMCDRNSVPNKCSQMITKEGEQIYPAPSYRFYSSELRNVQYLVKNKKASLQNAEAQIAETEAEIVQKEQNLRQMEDINREVDAHLKQLQREIRDLDAREFQLKEHVNINTEEEVDTKDYVSNLHDELVELVEEISNLEEEKKTLKQRVEEAKCERDKKEAALKNLATDFNIVKQQVSELRDEKIELEDQLYNEEERTKREKEKHEKEQNQEAKLTQNVESQSKIVSEAEQVASNNCERINTRRSVDIVEKDVASLNVYMDTLNSNLGNPQVILNQIQTLEDQREKLKTDLEIMQKHCKECAARMMKRKANYHNAMQITFLHISEIFRVLIKKQHFEGEVVFDHKEKVMKLDLKMKGKNKDAVKNLSGGERSYTTISLILAVWDKLRIPFYMLDEFDVFMDMMNRRICSDMLIAEAQQKEGRQFMFFTPQEMTLDASDKVTIHKLADPRAT